MTLRAAIESSTTELPARGTRQKYNPNHLHLQTTRRLAYQIQYQHNTHKQQHQRHMQKQNTDDNRDRTLSNLLSIHRSHCSRGHHDGARYLRLCIISTAPQLREPPLYLSCREYLSALTRQHRSISAAPFQACTRSINVQPAVVRLDLANAEKLTMWSSDWTAQTNKPTEWLCGSTVR